jgi:hypothetical protein
MRTCNCTAPVDNPKYSAWISTGGIGIWSNGRTIDEAVDLAKKHARKDSLKKREWVTCWVQRIDNGEEVWAQGFSTPYQRNRRTSND